MRLEGIAPAKINLYLHVTGRRPDGYHALDSVMAFVDLGDRLCVEPAEDLMLSVDGPFAAALGDPVEDNLVMGAARALRKHYRIDVGARMRLTKTLPVAAGIGGGSADAALALRMLCRLWDLPVEDPALLDLGAGLGADIPACLAGRPVHAGGIGEILTPLSLPKGLWAVLINPGTPLSTPAVFKTRRGDFTPAGGVPHWPDLAAMIVALEGRRNDLEPPARQLVPEISQVLEALSAQSGCRLARMSGSGATCFGLFADAVAARAAETALGTHAHWWVAAGPILEGGSEGLS